MAPSRRKTRHVPKSIVRSMPYIKTLVYKFPSGKASILILKKFPPYVINDIVEILYNIIKGNIRIKQSHFERLKVYKKPLLKLITLPKGNSRKNFIYKQSGGFIGAVLPVITSLLGGVIGNALWKV